MDNFLEEFAGTVQNRQVQQVLQLLNKRKTVGSIRNLQEFQAQFEQLMKELVSDTMKPRLSPIPVITHRQTSPDEYNEMLQQASDDLIASFEEVQKIEEVQISHEAIIIDNKFKNLRSAMNELNTKLNLYKLINNNKHGFGNAIYSTFNETKAERTNRELDISNTLFVDPKTNKYIDPKYDAEINLIGDNLSLNSTKTEVSISEVKQLLGGDFKQSVFTLNQEDEYPLTNMIDSEIGTFWRQSIRRLTQNETVKVKLEFKINGTREINYLEIEPDQTEMILNSINYLDKEENIQSLLDSSESYTIKERVKIPFSKISTDTLILEFTIVNSEEKTYENLERDNFNPLYDYVSPSVREEVLQSVEDGSDPISCYEYKIGLDNIRVGLSEYRNTGVYVSAPLFLTDETGTLGLLVKEQRPYLDVNQVIRYTSVFDSSQEYIGSFEYWIIKEDLDSDDSDTANLVDTDVFPIYPMNRAQILHERLLLIENSGGVNLDTGYLMHYPNTDESITVYRNGLAESSVPSVTQSYGVPNNGYRMKYKVQVAAPGAGDIFTVTYTPLKGNTYSNTWSSSDTTTQVDLVGDLTSRVGPEGLILMDESTEMRIESYRIYLVVILRQNTAHKETSPILEEYTLAVGKRNLSKFEEAL